MRRTFLALGAAVTFLATQAQADELIFRTVIKDHKFNPEVVEVPAGEKFTLVVENQDASAEEFESHDLKREKVISGGKEGTFKMGPLKPGEYSFFGEFNPETAQGKIVAKAKE